MSITYSGGRILVTNEALFNAQDIIDAGVSGAAKEGGNSYVFTVPITLTNSKWFDTAAQIKFQWGAESLPLAWDAASEIQWGELNAAGYGVNGCQVYMRHTNAGTASLGTTNGENSGNLRLYGCAIQGESPNLGNFFFRLYDDRVGQVCDLIDNLWHNFYGSGRYQGATSRLIRNTFVNCNATSAPFTTKAPFGDILDNVVLSGSNVAYWFPNISDSLTLDGIRGRGNDYFVYATDNNGTPGKTLTIIDADVDGKAIQWVGTTISPHRISEQYRYIPTILERATQAPITSGRVAIYDKDGAEVFNQPLDGNGQVGEAILIAGTYQPSNGSTRTDKTPHTVKVRCYGYQAQEFPVTMAARTVVRLGQAVNPYTVASEATAAGYASKISIAIVGGVAVYTISGPTNPQEMYDFTQWWASQSGNMQRDEPMTPVSPGVFDMGSSRIVIASGGTLTTDTDPAIGTLVFGDRPVGTIGIEVQSGGTLNPGTADTIGTVLDFTQDLTNDLQAYQPGYGSIESSGTVNWLGGVIQTHHYCAFRGGGQMSGNAEFFNAGTQTTSTGSYPSLQVDSPTFQITGGLFRNTALNPFQPPASLSGLEFIACNPAVVGARTDNVYITYTGVDISDPSNIKGYIFWDDRWARFVNHATGTDFLVQGNLPDHANNLGLGEVWQHITFTATSGSGAKFYTRGKNNGSRLASNLINNNPSYLADRDYTLTESGGAASTTGVGVLTGVYWRTIAGAYNLNNRFDSRGINNDKSDVFTWLKLERGQQPATANIVMKGTTAVQAEIQSLPDLADTGADTSGLPVSFGYAGGILTATVTGAMTLNQLHEAVCQAQVDNPAWVWDNGKAAFSATGDNVNFNAPNMALVVQAGATLTATGKTLTVGSYQIDGDFTGIVTDGTTTRVPVAVDGMVAGSRLLIRRTDNQAVIVNTLVAGTSHSVYYDLTGTVPIEAVVRNASGSPAYQEWRATTTLTASGWTVTANQQEDE